VIVILGKIIATMATGITIITTIHDDVIPVTRWAT
jgi:hypothetical protein